MKELNAVHWLDHETAVYMFSALCWYTLFYGRHKSWYFYVQFLHFVLLNLYNTKIKQHLMLKVH